MALKGKPLSKEDLPDRAWKAQACQMSEAYDSAEFTAPIGTDVSIKTLSPTNAFKNVAVAHRAIIRSDQSLKIRLRTATSPEISIPDTQTPFEISFLEFEDIFITTTAITNLKIILA